MTALATRRLIDATATLSPADRALVSLWTQRGLDDAALDRMTGVDAATITVRRAVIVERLSGELGLPPRDVDTALAALAASAVAAARGAPAADARAGPAVGAERDDPQAAIEPSDTIHEPRVEPEGSRRRRVPVAAIMLVGLVGVIAVVAITRGSRSSPGAPAGAPSRGTGTRAHLLPLPGGDARAAGTLAVSDRRTTLTVRVTGLPAAGTGGHYEVWLYNSVIDSVPLGALSAAGRGAFRVPAGARRYASIDVERQPPGTHAPSGASVLRSANPLR